MSIADTVAGLARCAAEEAAECDARRSILFSALHNYSFLYLDDPGWFVADVLKIVGNALPCDIGYDGEVAPATEAAERVCTLLLELAAQQAAKLS
jgi:energy-converting hydrogenase Eha subunit B